MYLKPAIIEYVNGRGDLEAACIATEVPVDATVEEILRYTGLSPEELHAGYRKQTEYQSKDYLTMEKTVTHRSGESPIRHNPHHATTEMRSYPYCIAEFEHFNNIMEVRLAGGEEKDWWLSEKLKIDLYRQKSQLVGNHRVMVIPASISVKEKDDQLTEYRFVLQVIDKREEDTDIDGLKVMFQHEDGSTLSTFSDGVRAVVEFDLTVGFFTPEYSHTYTMQNRPDWARMQAHLHGIYGGPKKLDELMEKGTIMTTDFKEMVEFAANALLNTDKMVRRIMDDLGVKDHPRFYNEFREMYGCTPTQYRKNAQEAATEERMNEVDNDVPWDFSVSVKTKVLNGARTVFDPSMGDIHHIDVTVNEVFEFTVELSTRQGVCPYSTLDALLRSEHREIFNDNVLEVLAPYFHGRLNLAYLPKVFLGHQQPYNPHHQTARF